MFEIITIEQLLSKLNNYNHVEIHVHHTWKPDHTDFNGSNGLQLQQGMRNYHVNSLGWADIGQHVTLLPDGKFVTGRDFGQTPASIAGFNTGAFACEMLGNFDIGNDVLEGNQKDSILRLAKYFKDKGRYVRFHRENSGKTCPGTSIDKTVFMNEVENYGKEPVSPTTSPSRGNAPTPTPLPQEESLAEKIASAKKFVGTNCLQMQQKLNIIIRAGLLDLPLLSEDSDFGLKSFDKLIFLQGKYNLKQDGLYGDNSIAKINSIIEEINKPKADENVKVLQTLCNDLKIKDEDSHSLKVDGDAGTFTKYCVERLPMCSKKQSQVLAVKYIQTRLNELKFKGENGLALKVDSDFGNNTAHALGDYQKSKKLVNDQVCGRNSWLSFI